MGPPSGPFRVPRSLRRVARFGSCHARGPLTRDPSDRSRLGNEILRPTDSSARARSPIDLRAVSHAPANMRRMTTARPSTLARRTLDDVSKAIIEQLQQDGRRSYAAIGKVVGLSEAAVRQRVQRLHRERRDAGRRGHRPAGARLRPAGHDRHPASTATLEPVADALAKLAEVDYVVITAGSYDLLVEVVCESDEHLLELISEKIRTIDGVDAHRDVHVPQAAQADLLLGCSLSQGDPRGPLAAGTRPPTPTGRRGRRCPATSTPTWRSSAPASPGSGPPTTWPRPTRRCGSSCSRRRSPGSAPPVATAAGARRCSRRPSTSWRRTPDRATAALAQHAAMRATVDEVGRVLAAEGIDAHFAKGGTIVLARTRAQLTRARAEVADARRWGRGEDDLRLLDAGEAAVAAAAPPASSARRTPPTARRSTPPGWCAAWPTAVERRGVAIHERTRASGDRARSGAHRPRHGAGRGRRPGDRGLHRGTGGPTPTSWCRSTR